MYIVDARKKKALKKKIAFTSLGANITAFRHRLSLLRINLNNRVLIVDAKKIWKNESGKS